MLQRRSRFTTNTTLLHQVYEAARNVLDAFAAKLSTSGPFIFGSSPTSLGACLVLLVVRCVSPRRRPASFSNLPPHCPRRCPVLRLLRIHSVCPSHSSRSAAVLGVSRHLDALCGPPFGRRFQSACASCGGRWWVCLVRAHPRTGQRRWQVSSSTGRHERTAVGFYIFPV